jgi:uncharacterized protein YqeY
MSILSQIKADLDVARRNKDSSLLTLLVTLYSECAMVGKTKRNGESTDEEVLSVIRKFKVGVEEIIKIKGNSEALDFEIALYDKYLPQMLSEEQLTSIINDIISSLSEKSPKQMGLVMKSLKDVYLGQYDGTLASKLVKELLA